MKLFHTENPRDRVKIGNITHVGCILIDDYEDVSAAWTLRGILSFRYPTQ